MSRHTRVAEKERKAIRKKIAKVQQRGRFKIKRLVKLKPKASELFEGKLFDVEHALGMYATSFFTLPAEFIYEKDVVSQYMDVAKKCHIYLIGYLPSIDLINAKELDGKLVLTFSVLNECYDINFDIPEGFKFGSEDGAYYLEHESGQRAFPNEAEIQYRLKAKCRDINFNVKYIGQSFGKDGSRNAFDRLLKHETLQKISLKGVPEGHKLSLLLLEVEPSNQLITLFNPFAENIDQGDGRIKSGLDKLFGTTAKERIALYEAALIRYFYPEYNKEFKDSFPSTNMKILEDCYEKDFSAIFAEINIDELPFRLYSDNVDPANSHIVRHDLHEPSERKAFFSGG